MIKILIADDHPVVRQGLAQILNNEPDMKVEGEAKNVRELFELTKKRKFDLIILDITMPDRNGLDALQQLKKERPLTPVLVLSVHSEEQYAIRVLKTGGAGYLTKESAPGELVKAIHKVVRGGKYISPDLAEKIAFDFEKDNKPPHELLSNREYQVMCMIASGMTISDISKKLYLSVKTVSTYRSRILSKMDLKNNAELTYYAIKNKLVD
ncbi:MAG: response regulator [Candidatus Dadabacteria bacterium]|nr:response regulator [Candidatus Dadabacteria bacterium]NIQ17081.1 response regulator [Candidatus Dadabacteria bacterium]